MKGIDAKLDLLIAAANPVSSSTPKTGARREEGRDDCLPPPRRLRQDENRAGYVDLMLQQERFRPAQVDGKAQLATDVFTENLLPKPYMYVTREGSQTVKQKLDQRASLSALEYIHAFVKLVNDHRAYDPAHKDDMLRHLQDVIHDAMDRSWEAVRRWTQQVWDAVERQDLRWGDTQLIQNMRVMSAIAAGQKATASGAVDHKLGKQEVICRQFNTRAGCRQRTHHDEGQVRHIHLCAFCDSLGRHCPGHNVMGCNNKTQYPGLLSAVSTGPAKKRAVGAPDSSKPATPRVSTAPRAVIDQQIPRDPPRPVSGQGHSVVSGDVNTTLQYGGPQVDHIPTVAAGNHSVNKRSQGNRQASRDVPDAGGTRDTGVSKRFHDIRRFCEGTLPFDRPVDTRPQAVAAHRRAEWPNMVLHSDFPDLVPIYNAVKDTGLPNAMAARISVPSRLNIKAWEFYLGQLGGREKVLDFVRYGFPTGYVGPVSHTVSTPNHPQPP